MTSPQPQQRPPAPEQYAGQWVAWDKDQKNIIASGSDVSKVRAEALAAGENDPLLEKVPPLDTRFVGGA